MQLTMRTFYKITVAALALLPSLAIAQVRPITGSTGYTFSQWVGSIVDIFNALTVVLSSIAIVVFFIGILRFIYNAGDTNARTAGRNTIIWGLISLFVLFSIGGIVQLLKSSLGL